MAALAAQKKKAYIGYTLAGFPGKGADLELARAVLANSDVMELGVPFSDPIADGPVLQRCSEQALAQGGGLARALELARILRAEGTDKPLVLMSYLNPLLALGLETFAHAAKAAGIDGVVIPDLPADDAERRRSIVSAGLDLVYLAAPTSTPARLKAIAKAATGFIYVVSVAGVTGERKAFDGRLSETVAELRRSAKVPLAIGFGVSSPESAREAAGLADGVVVASTVLKAVLDAADQGEGLRLAAERSKLLADAVRSL
jgi:tryptophan synthase alpha chain